MSITGVSSVGRMALIDALKAIGSQFIVLHHLAFYGPMSDWTQRMLPDLIDWLSQDARMAVQIFLVVGGFLAARSLAPQGVLVTPQPLLLLRKRYLRTAAPYLAALLLSLLCTELARYWMNHDSLPEPAELGQFLAHALLLHSLLGVDSISAGVWYVAIDFQLFALLLGLLWLARALNGRLALSATLLLLGVILSLYGFNLDSDWDIWALYFLGSYGLGALTYWATQPHHGLKGLGWLLLLALLVLGALALEFRERIALALMVALLLGAAQQGQWLQRWPQGRVWAYFGQISYSVFLLNFPVALVVNALFTRFAPAEPWAQTVGVLLAWVACNLAGAVFFHLVEQPLGRWGSSPRLPADTSVTSRGSL
ncbi:GTP cyclohydrolase [Malikia spinosa]|uniref:GTP cyclohydrolase n=2 Tax=Malikia spinosa TaxID=86180 RepID=A0A2S9KC59_9BURK|nr:GTP cyclohydrolase [Malikia spinosa]